MGPEKIFNPLRKMISSEPAAFVAGLLTVHRDLKMKFVVGTGIVDGSFLAIFLDDFMKTGNPKLPILAIPAITKVIVSGCTSYSKLRRET